MSLLSRFRGPQFSFNGGYLLAEDVEAAAAWYKRVFGCQALPWTEEDGTRGVVLRFGDEDAGIALLPARGESRDEPPPIVNVNGVVEANEFLSERGANVGPVQQDAQGTKYFSVRDCDGNELEICEEP